MDEQTIEQTIEWKRSLRRTLKLLGYDIEPTDVVIQILTQNENYPEATWLDYVTLKDQDDCDLATAKIGGIRI